jgi:hypothetical protein
MRHCCHNRGRSGWRKRDRRSADGRNRRLDDNSRRRRRNGDTHRRSTRDRTCVRTGNHRARRRTRGDGRGRRRRGLHDVRRLTRLRHDLAWLWSFRSRRLGHNVRRRRCGRANYASTRRRSRRDGWPHHDCRRCGCRPLRILSLPLRLLLAGQNSLHHIAGFGDIGEINLGTIVLLGSRRGR